MNGIFNQPSAFDNQHFLPIHLMQPHPHVLEISAWPWLERLSRAEGRYITLADVPPPFWDRMAQDGFDAVFLMGVWRRSAIGREIARRDAGLIAEYERVLPGWTDADVAGSPYCIQAYEPDDRMGGWRGLDAAHRELRNRGMSLIVDFVPNHTAFDHGWLEQYPERYVLGTPDDYRQAPGDFRAMTIAGRTAYVACGRDPYFPPWTDVAQLNYFNPDTRAAMWATLRTIASHCDGMRCDMAMLVFNDVFDRTWRRILRDRWDVPATEFWRQTTWMIPQPVYLAEVYWNLEDRILGEGFQFAYDKRLLDALHGADRARRLRAVLTPGDPTPARLCRFIENHDEPRSAAALASHLPAGASLMATLPGMRFFFDGQREGRRIRTPVQLARWPDEVVDPQILELYRRVLEFASEPVLHDGVWRILNVSPGGDDSWGNVLAYRWRLEESLAVIVVNLGDVASQAHVDVVGELPVGAEWEFVDRLTGESYRWGRDALNARGLWVRLESGRAHLFTVRQVH